MSKKRSGQPSSSKSAQKKYTELARSYVRKVRGYAQKNARLIALLSLICSIIVLIVTSLYGAVHASYQVSNDSDFLVYPYLFKHFHLHDMFLPSKHSNILFFPLYLLRGWIPYNYVTYSIATISLIVLTIWWWVYLLVKIFGKKYAPMICIVTACIIFGANAFMVGLAGDSIRNIEYPLCLSFILIINDILRGKQFSRRGIAYIVLISTLFTAALAGDSLLLPAIVLPLLLALFYYWLQTARLTKPMWQAFGLIALVTALSFVLKKVLVSAGVMILYALPELHLRIIPASHLSFSVTTAAQQLLDLHNANIFGLTPASHSLGIGILFVNLLILIIAIAGFLLMFRQIAAAYRKGAEITAHDNFIIIVLALSFIVLPLTYILTDQVVTGGVTRKMTSLDNVRYLTLLPLLSVAGFTLIVQRYYARNKALLYVIPIALVVVMAVSAGFVRVEQNMTTTGTKNMRTSVVEAVAAAHQNDVKVLLTGYWYESTVRFYSHDTIQTASVGSCGTVSANPNNSRLSWYTPDPSVHRSALLIDTSGPDRPFSLCPDVLIKTFGRPSKVVYMDGVNSITSSQHLFKHRLEMWIYNYDIRSRVSTKNLQHIMHVHQGTL